MYLVEAIQSIRDLGFDAVEILADTPHAWPPALDNDAIDRISAALHRTGLRLSNVNANTCRGALQGGGSGPGPTILDPDPAVREVRLRHLEQSLALTSRWGGSVMSFTSGPPPGGGRTLDARDGRVPTSLLQEGSDEKMRSPVGAGSRDSGDRSAPAPAEPPREAVPPDPNLDRLVDSALDRLLPLADRLGVRLAIEYEPDFYLGSAETTAAALARHPTMSLGVNLDLGHAWCVGEDPAAVIRRFGRRILNCHVEDIRDRVHYHLVPGDGEMPWGAIRAALLQIDYRRPLTLELYTMLDDPIGAGRRGLEFLRSVFSPGP